jgi:hypothetical protein
LNFEQSFSEVPRFIGALATYNGDDNAYLRYLQPEMTNTGVIVYIEEDTTVDAATDHVSEVVSYIAIEGEGTLLAREVSE